LAVFFMGRVNVSDVERALAAITDLFDKRLSCQRMLA
jgi:hypothetical protein